MRTGYAKEYTEAGEHDIMRLVRSEDVQEVGLVKAEDEFYKTVHNRSAGSNDDIERLRDELKSRRLLQHITGLYVNTTNWNEIQIKKSEKDLHRYENIFLEDNIDVNFLEVGKIQFIDELTSNRGKSTALDGKNHDDMGVFHILMIPKENKQSEGDKNHDGFKTRLLRMEIKQIPGVNSRCVLVFVENYENFIKANKEKFDKTFGLQDKQIICEGQYLMENRVNYRTTISYRIEPSIKTDEPNLKYLTEENKFFIYVLNPNGVKSCEKMQFSDEMMKCFGDYKWASGQAEMFSMEECIMVWIDATVMNLEDLLKNFDCEKIEQSNV